MNLFDSSALLCYLLDEPGADPVEQALDGPASCSAANWSEVAQKAHARRLNWPATRDLLVNGFGLVVEPVLARDAEAAAELWLTLPHLSLADRICLATGTRLAATVWTADTAWGDEQPVRQVR